MNMVPLLKCAKKWKSLVVNLGDYFGSNFRLVFSAIKDVYRNWREREQAYKSAALLSISKGGDSPSLSLPSPIFNLILNEQSWLTTFFTAYEFYLSNTTVVQVLKVVSDVTDHFIHLFRQYISTNTCMTFRSSRGVVKHFSHAISQPCYM